MRCGGFAVWTIGCLVRTLSYFLIKILFRNCIICYFASSTKFLTTARVPLSGSGALKTPKLRTLAYPCYHRFAIKFWWSVTLCFIAKLWPLSQESDGNNGQQFVFRCLFLSYFVLRLAPARQEKKRLFGVTLRSAGTSTKYSDPSADYVAVRTIYLSV